MSRTLTGYRATSGTSNCSSKFVFKICFGLYFWFMSLECTKPPLGLRGVPGGVFWVYKISQFLVLNIFSYPGKTNSVNKRYQIPLNDTQKEIRLHKSTEVTCFSFFYYILKLFFRNSRFHTIFHHKSCFYYCNLAENFGHESFLAQLYIFAFTYVIHKHWPKQFNNNFVHTTKSGCALQYYYVSKYIPD